ncbi:hypothetical protein L914_02221, partial [Phytophthora nicotianae]
ISQFARPRPLHRHIQPKMRVCAILLAVAVTVLASSNALSFTGATRLATLSRTTTNYVEQSAVAAQGQTSIQRRLRKYETVNDDSELEQDSEEEARGFVPESLTSLVQKFKTVGGNVLLKTKTLAQLKKIEEKMDAKRLKALTDLDEKKGYNPTTLRHAIDNDPPKGLTSKDADQLMEDFTFYWKVFHPQE